MAGVEREKLTLRKFTYPEGDLNRLLDGSHASWCS